MNNEKYNQIIEEAYENFVNTFEWKSNGTKLVPNGNLGELNENGELLSQEEFIDKIKTDDKFAEKWGLKIEERELIQRERVKFLHTAWKNNGIEPEHEEVSTLWVEYNNLMAKYNIPTKLITITYNNEKIEIYE